MTLQTPPYLFALLALLIPIAIHLFSKGAPKRVKVGSVQFIAPSASRTFRRVKFRDAGLLALRSTIFALLALSLASPELACKQEPRDKAWALIDPVALIDVDPLALRQTLDSLAEAGYEPHLLDANFPPLALADEPKRDLADVWSLLAEADARATDARPFVVVSPLRERSFIGKRPALSRKIVFVPTRVSETVWIERVSRFATDSLFIAMGTSDATETKFLRLVAPIPESVAVVAPVELRRWGDSVAISLLSKPSETRWLALSERRKWTIVFDDAFRKPLPYLERALTAIAAFASAPTLVETQSAQAFRADDSEWLVWLASAEPPNRPKLLDARGFSTERFFESAFIDSLAATLLPDEPSLNDSRAISPLVATPLESQALRAPIERATSLTFPLWVFATILIFIERWIASRNSR